MKKTLIITILSVLTFANLNSQIVTDRPDQTESSSTVGKGNLQIESGVSLGFEYEFEKPNRQIIGPSTLFRYGLTKGIELRLLSQLETIGKGDYSFQGISDLEIGFKMQLVNNEDLNTEIAFLSHLVVPSGTEGFSNIDYGTINKLAISHELSNNIGLGYNIGYNYFGKGSGDLTYSLALGIGVNDKVGIYIEPYGEFQNMEEFIANFNAGVTYLAIKNLQFDFSFGTGINHKMNYIALGLSWLIKKS